MSFSKVGRGGDKHEFLPTRIIFIALLLVNVSRVSDVVHGCLIYMCKIAFWKIFLFLPFQHSISPSFL